MKRLTLIILTLLLAVPEVFGQQPVTTPEVDDTTGARVCPLSQGYWKNHTTNWPVAQLTLGNQTYNQPELLTLLQTPPRGDASLILAHQLIAARLNIASGAEEQAASTFLNDANTLLAGFNTKLPLNIAPSSDIGQQMITLAQNLDTFNNRRLTPDCEVNSNAPVVVVEGPVASINGNTIIVSGFTIQLDPNDPLLQVLQVGDVISIEGQLQNTANGIVIIAYSVVFVDVDVVVDPENEVWRDNGNCDNPPPPWAPAHGWRRRCEGDDDDDNDDDDDGKDKDKDKDKDRGRGRGN